MRFYAILPWILQALAWPIAHGVFRLSGNLTVVGYENIENLKGPVVFAANHVNDLDPVLTRAMIPMFSKFAPLFWVSRHRKFYDQHAEEKFTGWRGFLYSDIFFYSWGAHPAYRGARDYSKSLKHHIKILEDGHSVVIFPRGGKEKYLGQSAPVHGGAAYLARHAGVPLVPVAIGNTLGINPHELFFGGRQLKVSIGKPISVVSPNGDLEFYKEKTREAIDWVDQTLAQNKILKNSMIE